MFLNVLQRRVLPLKQDPVEDDKDNTQPTDVNNGNNNQQNVFIFIQILNNNNNNGTKNDCGVNGDTVDRGIRRRRHKKI